MIISKLKEVNFSLLLLSLLPAAFVAGPFVVEFIINILIVVFLYNCVKNNNFYFLKNRIFLFFLFFYIYLIINILLSNFLSESALNVFSYIRFILFPFAICEILEKNKNNLKFVFLIFSVTIFIVVLDGYYQFIFEKNILGNEKYRIDRISGFFKEDLKLGSFISRILPLFFSLIFFFKNDLKFNYLNLLVFLLAFILIFLTGERAAFIMTVLALLIIIILIRSYLYLRIIFSFISIGLVTILMILNPTISDRYFSQLKTHILGESSVAHPLNTSISCSIGVAPSISIDAILPYYNPMFKTAYKMFEHNKLIGMGPKSFRYLCDDKRFVTYFPNRKVIIDNSVVKISTSWKELRQLHIKNFYVDVGDVIKKNDKIFSYGFPDDDKTYIYLSDKEGEIEKIYQQEKYARNNVVFDIIPQNSPKIESVIKNACNTHPHNFYFQLLSETGLIGFIFIFSLFVYLIYVLIIKRKSFSDSEICIMVGFFIVLWPLTTNGNFFNNWINLISFYPLGFLLHMLKIKKKERHK